MCEQTDRQMDMSSQIISLCSSLSVCHTASLLQQGPLTQRCKRNGKRRKVQNKQSLHVLVVVAANPCFQQSVCHSIGSSD